ncbi:MAG: endolytic transglycosylase MltG [Bauldia litoralis]
MKKLLKWLFGLAFLAVVAVGGVAGYGYHAFTKPGPLAADKVVFIPKGASLDAIAETLAKEGVIEGALIFKLGVRAYRRHGGLRAGEYSFPARVSARGAMDVLIDGKPILHRVTVPEGWTTWQILAKIRETPNLSGEITRRPGEGALLPDTYLFVRGTSRDEIVRRMQAALRRTLDEAWAKRLPDLPLKSKREILTLASIIEKETGKPEERSRIAGVFVNRLRRDMKLETDPTVIYGLTNGKGPLGRRLLRRDLSNEHPYNTYVHKGLPPGPIASPGRASIFAAVRPMTHKEFFFVADGTGGHVFARTFAEHKRNVAKWRRIRRELERKGER